MNFCKDCRHHAVDPVLQLGKPTDWTFDACHNIVYQRLTPDCVNGGVAEATQCGMVRH